VSPVQKQLRISVSKIETGDSISRINVAKFKIDVSKFNVSDSPVKDTGGWTVP
jgi:hypothetical protein